LRKTAPACPFPRLEQGSALTPEPLGQRGPGHPADRDDPFLVPLPEYPEQRQIGALHRGNDVAEVQSYDLTDSGTGAVEDLEQGAVAQDHRTGPDNGPEQQFRLVLAQRLRQEIRDRDRRQIERRIVTAQPLFDQETVKAPDAREGPGHRRRVLGAPQQLQVRRHVSRACLVDAVPP
jgi:hypothetical protein